MKAPGYYVVARDAVGLFFTFVVCRRCTDRLKRLPNPVQDRQLSAAVGHIAKHPERYDYRAFNSREEAVIYARLEADEIVSKSLSVDISSYLAATS